MKVKEDYPFWPRVQKILADRNITAVQLSQLSGVSPQTISHGILRKSIPQLDNAYRIANALNVSLDYLTFGQADHDDELDETFELIRKSNRESQIAKYLPFLDSSQMTAIETMLDSWKLPDLSGNEESVAK